MPYPYFPYQANYSPYMQSNTQAFQNAPSVPYTQASQSQVQNNAQAAAMQQSANNGLIWVQGIEGAKAHATMPGVPALLMDSECERFYIKTVDISGMPQPLRVFEYREVTETPRKSSQEAQDMSGYVTREEFEEYKKSVGGKAAKLTDE